MLFITVTVTQNRGSDRGHKFLYRLVINKVNKTFNNQSFIGVLYAFIIAEKIPSKVILTIIFLISF